MALAFTAPAFSFERIVLLAPAAGDVLIKLGVAQHVVGVTRANDDFPAATKVGSHVKPNIELIHSLRPDLIIIGNDRFFNQRLQNLFAAQVYPYQPTTLAGIQQSIDELGRLLAVPGQADRLNRELANKLDRVLPLDEQPRVVFEVSELPLTIAGQGNIVADIVRKAGGVLLAPQARKLIKYNVESVVMARPDLYLYQQGPMNPAPSDPAARTHYQRLNMAIQQVDQLRYSRANTGSFDLVLELNQRFAQHPTRQTGQRSP